MTECLVYYIAPGVTVLGSDVDEGLQRGEGGEPMTGIPLVGQSIAPKHCRITRGESGSEVVIEAIEGAVTFVNGRCAFLISLTLPHLPTHHCLCLCKCIDCFFFGVALHA